MAGLWRGKARIDAVQWLSEIVIEIPLCSLICYHSSTYEQISTPKLCQKNGVALYDKVPAWSLPWEQGGVEDALLSEIIIESLAMHQAIVVKTLACSIVQTTWTRPLSCCVNSLNQNVWSPSFFFILSSISIILYRNGLGAEIVILSKLESAQHSSVHSPLRPLRMRVLCQTMHFLP